MDNRKFAEIEAVPAWDVRAIGAVGEPGSRRTSINSAKSELVNERLSEGWELIQFIACPLDGMVGIMAIFGR